MTTSSRLLRRTAVLPLLLILVLSAQPAAAASSHIVFSGSRAVHAVALTFDDGYDPDACRSIYRTLVRYGAGATWFPNSMVMPRAKEMWRMIAARFPIANHTVHHEDLRYLSASAIRFEIAADERQAEAITGRPMVKILRPPGGAIDADVLRAAGALGYATTLLWDVDSNDWRVSLGEISADRMYRNAISGHNGSIVLMHCGPSVTPLMLPAIIRSYQARGYRLVTVPQLLRMSSRAARGAAAASGTGASLVEAAAPGR
jgi:peptidoglycan/xylan/chitin deacetylase (PgdA/CDA1 family)